MRSEAQPEQGDSVVHRKTNVGTSSHDWRRRGLGCLALVALIALAILRSWWGTQLDSFTIDEPYHIVAGTHYARSGDFRLNPEHPPLVKSWVGRWMPESFRLRPLKPLSDKIEERNYTEETLFLDNDAQATQATARLAMWTFHALLLLALGALIWRACGLSWALGTLGFVALEPTAAAHMPVVMTDLPLALTLAIAAVAAGIALTSWRWRWICVFGVAMGLALASKHSALPGLAGLAVVGVIALLARARGAGGKVLAARLCKLACAGLLALGVLWAQYGFHFHASADGSDPFNRPLAAKIDDLKLPHWRSAITAADAWAILPRPYLWGLADTVRAGVEGRGETHFFLFGTLYEGRPPLLFWPGVIAAKVPLALLALAALGLFALWRAPLSPAARWTVIALCAVAAAHLAALTGSQGTYGGVRHATPILLWLALLGGAAVWRAASARSSALRGCVAALLALALGMTWREPRVWEYHNELVGGSAQAQRSFSNEGLDLGQRYAELKRFHDEVIVPSGKPLYSWYWFIKEQARRDGVRRRSFATDLDDTNAEGIFDGYFALPMGYTMPRPDWDWDPSMLEQLEPVARFGQLGIWRGRLIAPKRRAESLYDRVIERIYSAEPPDWTQIVARLEEITTVLPIHVGAAAELGNGYLRLGRREDAIRSYSTLLNMPTTDALLRAAVESQIALLRAGTPLRDIGALRNPWLE